MSGMPAVMICKVPLSDRSPIFSNFSSIKISIRHPCFFYLPRLPQKTLVLFLLRLPFAAVGAAHSHPAAIVPHDIATLDHQIAARRHRLQPADIFRVFGRCVIVVHMPPGAELVINRDNVAPHLRERLVIAENPLRLHPPQQLLIALHEKRFLIRTVPVLRYHIGRNRHGAPLWNPLEAKGKAALLPPAHGGDHAHPL